MTALPADFTRHGGGLAAAIASYGGTGADWLDLSTGVNPQCWPGVAAVAAGWERLPDAADLGQLEQTAAHAFGCRAENLCTLPGTELGLRLVGAMLAGPAWHQQPCYGTHSEMIAGSAPATAAQLTQTAGGTLVLANPNNPDGQLFNHSAMLDLLQARGANGWLVVDEAYADCHPDDSLASEVQDDRRLLIFRSFGKFFGLPGLRLGFVLGPQEILAGLRVKLGSWPVSTAAIAIGTAAYADQHWIQAERLRLRRRGAALAAVLQQAGLQPQGASPLFQLVHCPDAQALFERLGARHILTRPFADAPNWLRIGLPPDAAALRRLQEALRHD